MLPDLPFIHFVRLGTSAEKDYLTRSWPSYDGLGLNANLVDAAAPSLSVFTTNLRKPFFIDPITYAFALEPRLILSRPFNASDPTRGPEVRSTFRHLAERYGLDAEILGQRKFAPSDFDGDRAADFAARVIGFQRDELALTLQREAAFLLADMDGQIQTTQPSAFVAPYFVDDGTAGVVDLNIRLLNHGAALVGESLMAVVGYDSTRLEADDVLRIADDYQEAPPFRAMVWPTDLDEHKATRGGLQSYASLVQRLAEDGRAPIAAYGGFFALLLKFRGMTGLSHGLGYGDKRDLEPVLGGGLPPARYYLPAIRDGIAPADLPLVARGLSEDEFFANVCDCTICRGLVERGGIANFLAEMTETQDRPRPKGGTIPVATPRVYRLTRFHFLQARATEIATVLASDWATTEAWVNSRGAWAAGRLGDRMIVHLQRWLDVAQPPEAGGSPSV